MRVTPTVPKHPYPSSLSPVLSLSTATPPDSPNPYDASSEDEDEDLHRRSASDEYGMDEGSLDESFLLVRREDDEVSTSSTIGTSLRDSMIAELSDTSASASGGSISGGSVSGDALDPFDFDDTSRESSAPIVAENDDDALIGGSYTEADVRSVSDIAMDDSRSTLQDSGIQLIFPDPVASLTSSEGVSSDSTTPNGSLANLIRPSKLSRADTLRQNAERFERLTRTARPMVDESWLRASRMLSVPPEVEKMMEDLRPYERLGSMDISSIGTGPFALPPVVARDEELGGTIKQSQGEWRKVPSPSSPSPAGKRALDRLAAAKEQRHHEARKAWAEITTATLGGLGKKWGIVAIASMLSLALLGTVGPHAAFSMLKSKQTAPAVAVPDVAQTTSMENLVTQLVPDLLSIKQAISSFSTATQNALVPDAITTKESSLGSIDQTKRKRKAPMHSTDRSVSVRNQDVALTLRPAAVKASLSIIPQALRERIGMVGAENQTSRPAEPAKEDPQDHLEAQPRLRLSEAFAFAKNYSLGAYSRMDLWYSPLLLALERELGELYSLTRKLIRISSEASGPALESASQAILRAHKSLESAAAKLYSRLAHGSPPPLDKDITNQAIYRAQAGLGVLTDYVESQASAVQEQSAILLAAAQQRSLESLKQARRGLDRLIDMLGGEQTVRLNVERDGPMPFERMGAGAEGGGACARCQRERTRNRNRRGPKVKRSKWSRMQ